MLSLEQMATENFKSFTRKWLASLDIFTLIQFNILFQSEVEVRQFLDEPYLVPDDLVLGGQLEIANQVIAGMEKKQISAGVDGHFEP